MVQTVTKTSVGRPVAQAGTVRINRNGIARLSPDLCVLGRRYIACVDKRKKTIMLAPSIASQENSGLMRHYCIWYSNKFAKSGLLHVIGILKELGIALPRAAGVYRGKIEQRHIEIDLSKKLGD